MSFLTNIYLWISLALLFLTLFILLMILLVIIGKKTHAIIEFKAWIKGIPIAMFFQENRYVEWKPVKPDAGVLEDKNYGTFIINERATYIDKKTKNVILPFDSNFGAGINIHAAKLADDLQYVMKDEEEMKKFRWAVANNVLDDSAKIEAIKTTVNIGALKSMMNALIPHNINAKIEKVIASRMKNYGQINVPQVAILFAAIFGAILLGALVIKLAFPSRGS